MERLHQDYACNAMHTMHTMHAMKPKQIGAGSFGTVFSPAIGVDDPNVIGKVMVADYTDNTHENVDAEWREREQLFKLDPGQVYFVYPLEQRKIDVEEYNKYAKTPVEISLKTQKHMVQLTMPNGGLTLRKRGKNGLLTFRQVLEYSLQAARCIELMLANKMVHLDFHADNIVVNDEGKCRAIDFGLMKHSSMFYTTKNYLWSCDYAINPPEFRLVQARNKASHNLGHEQKLMTHYVGVEANNLNHVFDNASFQDSYDSIRQAIAVLDGRPKITKLNRLRFLKSIKSHEKTDIYGLGITMMELLSYLKDDHSVEKVVTPEIVKTTWDIIVKMIMPHPQDRMNIGEFIREMSEVRRLAGV